MKKAAAVTSIQDVHAMLFGTRTGLQKLFSWTDKESEVLHASEEII